MFLCQFGQIPPLVQKKECRQEAMQTPTGSAPKTLCLNSPLFFFFFCFCLFVCFFFFCFFFLFCVWGAGEHNLALTDPVVSEKMFEECGRRHRRACLDDKLTNQYIKRSARIIRSKICRIKMTYTFEDAVKEDNQIECDFTGLLFCSRPVTQKRFWNAILLWNVSEKTYRTNLHIYRFNFSDAIFVRSRLCRGPNSKKWNWPYLLNLM